MRQGYNVLVVRLKGKGPSEGAVMVNLNYAKLVVLFVEAPLHFTPVLPLVGIECSCKSKSTVVTNYPLRSLARQRLTMLIMGRSPLPRKHRRLDSHVVL